MMLSPASKACSLRPGLTWPTQAVSRFPDDMGVATARMPQRAHRPSAPGHTRQQVAHRSSSNTPTFLDPNEDCSATLPAYHPSHLDQAGRHARTWRPPRGPPTSIPSDALAGARPSRRPLECRGAASWRPACARWCSSRTPATGGPPWVNFHGTHSRGSRVPFSMLGLFFVRLLTYGMGDAHRAFDGHDLLDMSISSWAPHESTLSLRCVRR